MVIFHSYVSLPECKLKLAVCTILWWTDSSEISGNQSFWAKHASSRNITFENQKKQVLYPRNVRSITLLYLRWNPMLKFLVSCCMHLDAFGTTSRLSINQGSMWPLEIVTFKRSPRQFPSDSTGPIGIDPSK
jgi:hypothetical protein